MTWFFVVYMTHSPKNQQLATTKLDYFAAAVVLFRCLLFD